MRTILLLISILFTSVVSAQGQSGAQTIIPASQDWRVHAGDDPSYASPAYDDTSWTTIDFGGANLPADVSQGHARWLRKRFILPPEPGPVDLLLIGEAGSYEVYVDGYRIGPAIQSSLTWKKNIETIYPLRGAADPSKREVEVAIRSHLYLYAFAGYINFHSAMIGNPAAIATAATAHRGRVLGASVFTIAVNLLTLLLGAILISLYFQQRRYPEYLWLGLSGICFALCGGLVACEGSGFLPVAFNGFLGDPATFFIIAAELEFVYAFIRRKPGRAVRLYQTLLIILPFVMDPLEWVAVVPYYSAEWIENGITFPGIILLIALLVLWFRRGNREAGLLIIPMLLANASGILFNTEIIVKFAHPGFAFPSFYLGLVQFDYWPISQAIFLVAIGLIIFRRFNQLSFEQAQTQADLQSARSIQQILIPEALPTIPGFRIESVYHPAQQVGGDFFQIIPISTGGVLAVIGDVSGKGLPAAMNVALLVGTLRTLAETTTSPAKILAGLNRRLLGRSTGFTTCLALRILPNGSATLASAGHLNPYLVGSVSGVKEIEIDASLPLGLSSSVEYADIQLTLHPGDTLTLLTDGVLEARDPRTGALFGFERTMALSARPANEIAETARHFGQEDDIAVLTLQLTGA